VQHVLVGVLLGAIAAQLVADLATWPGALRVAVSVLVAVLGAVAHARLVAVRLFLSYAAVAPVLFVLLFVVSSSAGELLRQGDAAKVVDVHGGNGAPVVMVVLDELPTASLLDSRGNVDAGLYPNLARLQATSTWYRNNSAISSTTEVAVPGIMTGRFPESEGILATSSNYPQNIFTMLGHDYTLHVSERVTKLCPPSLCPPTHAGGLREVLREARALWLDRFDPEPDAELNQFDVGFDILGAHRAADFQQFLAEMQPAPRRLEFVHTLLPHQAWSVTPDLRHYTPAPNGLVFYSWIDTDAGRIARQRHVMQVQAVDRMLGTLFDRLREEGEFDDALIVVTADHGVSFTANTPIRAVDRGNLVDIAWAPLLIKAPHQRAGRIDDRIAQSVDILPTVVDILDLDPPWEFDGRSLLGAPRTDDTRRMVHYELDVVDANNGEFFEFDGEAGFRSLLARGAAVAGSGADPLRIFRDGAYGDLVGRAVDDLDVGAPVTVGGELSDPVRTIVDGSEPAPRFDSSATLDAPPGTVFAVAVDGRFAAWNDVHEDVDPNIWWMVPPSLMPNGRHELTLYRLDGPPDAPVLRPVRSP
jgi:hypothetical protein